MKDSLVDDSREQTHKTQLAEDREVTYVLQSRYDSWVIWHPIAAQDFVDTTKEILSDAGLVLDNVTARVKSFRSLRQEALCREADGSYAYPDLWHNIHNIIGVRVTTYRSTEIPAIMDALGDSLTMLRTIDKTAETRISSRSGYGSQHLICKVSTAIPSELVPHADIQLKVQLHTVLRHAWAEFRYNTRYKAPEGTTGPRINRAFALAADLIELADQQFDQVTAVLKESTLDDSVQGKGEKPSVPTKITADDIVATEETLPGVLAMLLLDAPRSESEHHNWAEELLERNGIRTVGQLQGLFNPQHLSTVNKAMKYRFNPGHVRVIDDLLLAARDGRHIKATAGTSHNPERRPARLRAWLQQLAEVGMPMSDVPEDD